MNRSATLARSVLLALCVGSCLTLACSDEEDANNGGSSGSSGRGGEAGEPDKGGSNQGGKPSNGGSSGKAGNDSGEAGEPSTGGMPTEPGAGGEGGGNAPASFVDFVHDLVENRTSDTGRPATVDRDFSEERDDHGHYLTGNDAFADLY